MMMNGLQHNHQEAASISETPVMYPLTWRHMHEDEPPDISGLPSLDHALYLFNTVKFHLGQQYRFFSDGSFEQHLQQFYHGDARANAAASRTWYAQFLVVLAFGTAFLSKSRHPNEAPGAKYFTRAMAVLPGTTAVWKDALLAMETLALVALYYYATNHRESALLFVSSHVPLDQTAL